MNIIYCKLCPHCASYHQRGGQEQCDRDGLQRLAPGELPRETTFTFDLTRARRRTEERCGTFQLKHDPNRSRQVTWQLRKAAAGLCQQCGKRPKHPDSTGVCLPCLKVRRERARKLLGLKPHHAGGPGRKPFE